MNNRLLSCDFIVTVIGIIMLGLYEIRHQLNQIEQSASRPGEGRLRWGYFRLQHVNKVVGGFFWLQTCDYN